MPAANLNLNAAIRTLAQPAGQRHHAGRIAAASGGPLRLPPEAAPALATASHRQGPNSKAAAEIHIPCPGSTASPRAGFQFGWDWEFLGREVKWEWKPAGGPEGGFIGTDSVLRIFHNQECLSVALSIKPEVWRPGRGFFVRAWTTSLVPKLTDSTDTHLRGESYPESASSAISHLDFVTPGMTGSRYDIESLRARSSVRANPSL